MFYGEASISIDDETSIKHFSKYHNALMLSLQIWAMRTFHVAQWFQQQTQDKWVLGLILTACPKLMTITIQNLPVGMVPQVLITVGWSEEAQNEKYAQHLHT